MDILTTKCLKKDYNVRLELKGHCLADGLPVINGNSLMAVACIYLHRRHVL